MTTPSKASQRMVPVDARPITPQDAQQPPENRSGDALGTPGGVTGSQGLGDAIRAAFTVHDVPLKGYLDAVADKADALERERDDYHALVATQSVLVDRQTAAFRRVVKERDEARAAVDSLTDEATRQSETIGRVRDLFAGGPDTPCSTAWRDGVECAVVPLPALNAALDGTR
jgi:hypothetical protein